MIKVQIKYNTEDEKERIIKVIGAGGLIKSVSKPYKQGKYYRVYVDVE